MNVVVALGKLHVSPAALLGRIDAPVHGRRAQEQIKGRRVLVTGAGGSIGGELVRQVSKMDPAVVYLLDHDENALHGMQLELSGHGLLDDETAILADIREGRVMDRVMRQARPDVVFHAAAHKHLPLLERHPCEALRTNVQGTANVVTAAAAAGTQVFVNISTDKAANPTSVLGATKRLAETIVCDCAGRGMRVASVRFGNVLGSHGSFLRSLAYQIEHQLPVTVTHPDMTRYFMTIPEAAGLVVEAASMAVNGETYVLDMGEPVRILDIVQRYIHEIGGDQAIITFTGPRPGEKLSEELYDSSEVREATEHPRISRVHCLGVPSTAGAALALAAAPDEHVHVVRDAIFDLLSSTPTPELLLVNA